MYVKGIHVYIGAAGSLSIENDMITLAASYDVFKMTCNVRLVGGYGGLGVKFVSHLRIGTIGVIFENKK